MIPLVSILIPVYNAAKHLEETINSAKNQTWENKEIIIVDDGSEDDSFQIAKKFENKWIKVVKQNNRGASAARNHALFLSKGEYIQFLDADDLLSPNKIEIQVNALLKKPQNIAICSTIFFFDGENHLLNKPAEGELNYLFSTQDSFEFLLNLYGVNGQKAMLTVHSWLIPRGILDKAGNWNESITVDDDGEYFCRVVLESKGLVYTPNVFNYYRKFKNGCNLSGKNDTASVNSMIKAINLKYRHLITKYPNEAARINLTMAKHYLTSAANIYPSHKHIVNYCLEEAGKMGYTKVEYEGGKAGKLFSKFFGWKLTKKISYIFHFIRRKFK